MAAAADVTEAPHDRAIATPRFDGLATGGASIAFIAVLLVLPRDLVSPEFLAGTAVLAALINWPHFATSAHVLYTTPGVFRKHPWATGVIPAALMLWGAVAVVSYEKDPILANVLHTVSAMYLAWHYTGQAWGMMASFAHLTGLRFDNTGRLLIRTNLRVLLLWHVVWNMDKVAGVMDLGSRFEFAYQGVSALAIGSSVLGAAGLYRLWKTQRRLPARVVIPWVAIHLWYALLYRFPGALFWVQTAHATQYLLFPMRVVANREARSTGSPAPLWHWLRYYALLVAAGLCIYLLLPTLAQKGVDQWMVLGIPASRALVDVLTIHHYFVDGCIWKISNPEVRKDLFAHLAPR